MRRERDMRRSTALTLGFLLSPLLSLSAQAQSAITEQEARNPPPIRKIPSAQ